MKVEKGTLKKKKIRVHPFRYNINWILLFHIEYHVKRGDLNCVAWILVLAGVVLKGYSCCNVIFMMHQYCPDIPLYTKGIHLCYKMRLKRICSTPIKPFNTSRIWLKHNTITLTVSRYDVIN